MKSLGIYTEIESNKDFIFIEEHKCVPIDFNDRLESPMYVERERGNKNVWKKSDYSYTIIEKKESIEIINGDWSIIITSDYEIWYCSS